MTTAWFAFLVIDSTIFQFRKVTLLLLIKHLFCNPSWRYNSIFEGEHGFTFLVQHSFCNFSWPFHSALFEGGGRAVAFPMKQLFSHISSHVLPSDPTGENLLKKRGWIPTTKQPWLIAHDYPSITCVTSDPDPSYMQSGLGLYISNTISHTEVG